MTNTPTKPKFNRFELLSRLGSGMHGRVYLAWDPQLERKVALKVLTVDRDSSASLDQFMSEARAVAKVAHPHVIPLFDAGNERGVPYLVFEYVPGQVLKEQIRGKAFEVPTALGMMAQILDGVGAAHALQIAHLDLSPNNILADQQGRLRVMDFGLARWVRRERAANVDEIQGTPRYMSPEHFLSGRLSLRTDVFALGLIFYELLTGGPAFEAQKFSLLRQCIEDAQLDWSKLHDRKVPPEVIAVIRDAVARDPKTRFSDAGEMLAMLRDAQLAQSARENQDLAVQFLLRRLQRRPEFPAFSNSIAEINRLTSDDSTAGLQQLSAVVMRDFSLANRLMKVANSAFFDRGAGGATTVMQAIQRVGTKTLRMLCNGLLMFEHLKSDNPALQDALVSSFVAGLLGRGLAAKLRKELTDEVFVSAMFNRLGRNLVIYYLREEHEEIARLLTTGTPENEAERRVLATTSAAVGAAIAAAWKFPPELIATMLPLPSGELPPAHHGPEFHRYFAHFPNELCALAATPNGGDPTLALSAISQRYQHVLQAPPEVLAGLLQQALDKFSELAPTLGIARATSGFCQRLEHFLAAVAESVGEQTTESALTPA